VSDLSELKEALPGYKALRDEIYRVWPLNDGRRKRGIIIGIDGRRGQGKTSLASWLAWQFNIEAIHFDVFRERDACPTRWRVDDLSRVISARIDDGRQVIVESFRLLDALASVGLEPDFLVFIGSDEQIPDAISLNVEINEYFSRESPRSKANFRLDATELYRKLGID
jgi:hypothetical protein